MTRTPVDSSMIRSIGYDKDSLALEVEFTSGAVCLYEGVKPEHHYDLMKAQSYGKHFNAHIKGKYDWKYIENPNAKKAENQSA